MILRIHIVPLFLLFLAYSFFRFLKIVQLNYIRNMNEMDVLRTEYSFFEIVMLKFGHFSMSINICLIIKFHKIIKVKTCFFLYIRTKKPLKLWYRKKWPQTDYVNLVANILQLFDVWFGNWLNFKRKNAEIFQ